MRQAVVPAAVVLAAVVLAAGGGSATPANPSAPLLGANYLHYMDTPPNCSGPGIVSRYDRPGIRALVRSQLAAMRAAGMQSLRLLVYHSSVGDEWGLAGSAGGRLSEPYRTNLVQYLQDVRAAGFLSLTVAFNPWGANDPIGYTQTPYDPATFEENWQLIRDVRPLVKEFGPKTTRIDLINEGAPHTWQPGLREYVARMWARYVDEFGAADATVSVIANPSATPRLPNLVEALRETGRPLPGYFDIHPSYTPGDALADLRRADGYLTSQGLTQPLVIGEEIYENARVAAAIATFVRTSSRPVLEVMPWPLRRPGPPWDSCPNAPYRIAAYARALTDIRPFTLVAGVSRGAASLMSAGVQLTALGPGLYTVIVRDSSGRYGVRLVGPHFDRRTARRFRGSLTWRVRLRAFDELRYGLVGGRLKTVAVLDDGES